MLAVVFLQGKHAYFHLTHLSLRGGANQPAVSEFGKDHFPALPEVASVESLA